MATVIGKIRTAKKEEVKKELTVAEIKAKLTELNIEFKDKAKKDELLALLPQE